jgi:amino acid adenylation domain-containing protein
LAGDRVTLRVNQASEPNGLVKIEQLLSKLQTLDIQISVEGERLRCSVPKGRLSSELEHEIVAHKAELIGAIRAINRRSVPRRESQSSEPFPLSFAQGRFWFLQNLDPKSTAYNITAMRRLAVTVDCVALESAFQLVQSRHEILRAVFPELDGAPAQVVRRQPLARLRVFDFSTLDKQQNVGRVDAAIRDLSGEHFDLAQGPLLRLALVKTEAGEALIVLVAHHIVCDAWSLGIFFSELLSAYESFVKDRAPALAGLQIQYGDYAQWERERLISGALSQQVEYWKDKLDGAPRSLELPLDRPRPVPARFSGKIHRFQFSSQASQGLNRLAREEGATPFMVLLSVFSAMLARCARQREVLIGTPYSTRNHSELESLIGCFINTHVLRCSVPEGITTRELLASVRTTVIESFSNAEIPFEVLVDELVKDRDLARSPLFQVAFILQNTPKANEYDVVSGGTALDLTLYIWESGGAFEGSLEYNANLFDPATISGFAGSLETLAEGMVAEPNRAIDRLPLVSPQQAAYWVEPHHGPAMAFPRGCTHEWVDRQTAETPQAVAVICGKEQLTFEELNARSNQLAHHLRELGVGPERLVAICLDRSIHLAVAPLAVWKAGGAYVPLDPKLPPARLSFLLEDSAAAVVITESEFLGRLPSNLSKVVCLDRAREVLKRKKTAAPPAVSTAENLAYVLYTSGSTGTPKGVEITHQSLMSFLRAMQRELRITPQDRLLAITTFSFDIAGLEFYLPWVTGASVIISPRDSGVDGSALAKLLHEKGITIMQATPVTWRLMLDSGWRGTRGLKILCGGEELPRELANQLVSTGAEVWNLYGPTETTIWSTIEKVQAGNGRVPIGRPIANTQVYIEDEKGNLVPPGFGGELLIGGEGLARGYLRREELTAERFVGRPYHPGKRLYRTGDFGRQLPDGALEYLGRIDNQVKIRGFRVELGEIEAILERRPGISQAVVVVREDAPGDRRLTAYLQTSPGTPPDSEALRRSLASVLPDYMIPAAFMRLEQLPMTSNRKVNRRALLEPQYRPGPGGNQEGTRGVDASPDGAAGRWVPPSNHVELVMVRVWQEVLGVDVVSARDSFFELGGNSLMAVRLISRLKSELRMDLPLRSIFADPTITSLSGHISYDPLTKEYKYMSELPRWNCLVPAQPRGNRIPFFFVAGYQRRDDTLLILSQLIPSLLPDQPVFGFKPRWIDGGNDYTSVEEMVRKFVAELRMVQPKGPYFLGGHCVGGIAALEVARALIREGEQVKLVILLDTQRPTRKRIVLTDLFFFRARVQHMLSVISEILRAHDGTGKAIIRHLLRRKLGIGLSPQARETDRFHQAKARYRRLLYSHQPEKYPEHVALIVNQQEASFNPDLGWTGFVKSLDKHVIAGDRHTILTEHGKEVAHAIAKSIGDSSKRAEPPSRAD